MSKLKKSFFLPRITSGLLLLSPIDPDLCNRVRRMLALKTSTIVRSSCKKNVFISIVLHVAYWHERLDLIVALTPVRLLGTMVSYDVALMLLCLTLHRNYPSADADVAGGLMLVRAVPKTSSQVESLQSLKGDSRGFRTQLWRHPDEVDQHVDIWVSSKTSGILLQFLRNRNITYEIVISDSNRIEGLRRISMTNIENYVDVYQTHDEIVGEIKRLTQVFVDYSTLLDVGVSYEGRNLFAVHIHANKTREKPVIFLNCGAHAREWLGVASCKYVIRQVLFNHPYDMEIKKMLDDFDLIILPLMNPDGYVFSHDEMYRLWRKSRSPTSLYGCIGVDLNRNFNYRWGGSGSSPDPCDETYCGERPFSEGETLALTRFLYSIRRKLKSFVDVHTFGQMWMSPWGYTAAHPKHYETHLKVLKKIRKAILRRQQAAYKIGLSSRVLYETSGDSLDWVYGRLGVVHTYAVELRPPSSVRSMDGFQATSQLIRPAGDDLLVGLKTLALAVADEMNAKS